jgi:hypothetical protein
MARINVNAKFSAPGEINIPLVRADIAATCNIFRTFFEIFLALFSSVLGYCLSIPKWEKLHWFIIIVLGGACLTFLFIAIKTNHDSKKDLTSE